MGTSLAIIDYIHQKPPTMHNQHETINHNLVKAIGLAILMAVMAIAYFSGHGADLTFGLPVDAIENTDKGLKTN